MLSALTGVAVATALWMLSVRLWFVWGVLTFIFNFIPNVGSLIAMVLPLSVIIVDVDLTPVQKLACVANAHEHTRASSPSRFLLARSQHWRSWRPLAD